MLSLVLGLAVMGVMCLNLASNAKHPHEQLDERSRTDQTAIMVVSLCATLATFVLTMIGAGSALARMCVLAMRISAAGTRRVHSKGASEAGHGSRQAPLHACTHTG